jgi:GNAT superfamily N-acetyltransferase
MDVDVQPVTPDRWDDLVQLFERQGPHGGRPVTLGCWCMYWRLPAKEFDSGWGRENRAALEERVSSGAQPGLLAYEGGEPVGWCSLGPRDSFVRLERSRVLQRPDDAPVWSIVCFYVQSERRRQGVATALLEAAVAHAAAHGADLVEAYGCKANDSDPFTGHETMFEAVRFERVEDRGRRAIMRRAISAAGRGSTASRTAGR